MTKNLIAPFMASILLLTPCFAQTHVTIRDQQGNVLVSGYESQDAISVAIAPQNPTVPSDGTMQFSATVQNSLNTAVSWSASLGSIDGSGLFAAPHVTADTLVTITVTSVADQTQSASTVVTVKAAPPPPPPPPPPPSGTYPLSMQTMGVVQVISPVPSMSSAGTIVTPSDFNNPIVRLTDGSTGGSNGGWHVTPTGADADEIFNTDSTFIVVTKTGNATHYVVGFDPSSMKPLGVVPGFAATGQVAWSQTDSKALYQFVGTKFTKWTFSSATVTPVASLLFDFNTCPGFGPITAYSYGHLKTDATDSVISTIVSAGGQDSAVNVIAYNLQSGQCSFYNTATGKVGGNWGHTGAASDGATYRIHESYLSKSGFVAIVMAGSGCTSGDCTGMSQSVYFWTPGTTNVTHASSGSGHNVAGFNNFLNFPAFPRIGIQNMQTGARLPNWAGIYPTCCAQVGEAHMSWNNATSDASPVFITSSSTPNAPAVLATPLVNEIYAQMADGTFRRFAHTYTTGSNTANFYDAQAIGAVSQDGKFFAWTSDWGGTLGTFSNGSLRADVFVVKLQ